MDLASITGWQFAALFLTAMLTGFSKTGLPAAGILGVTIMASSFAAKQSVGLILPMLIIADIVAVTYYRRQVVWRHLITLIPWVLVGVVAGYYLMRIIADNELKLMIGIIVLVLVIVHIYREHSGKLEQPSTSIWFSAILGILAGFTTMVGNAAGGVMAIYLLSRKLPKEQFIGTGAWFYLFVNVFKIPFNIDLGIISWDTLLVNSMTIPVILLGTWIGIKLVPKLSQKQFQTIILALSAIGAVQLIASSLLA
jgi:Predicted permeases